MVKKRISNFSLGQFDMYDPEKIPEGGAQKIFNYTINADGTLNQKGFYNVFKTLGGVKGIAVWTPKYILEEDEYFPEDGYYYIFVTATAISINRMVTPTTWASEDVTLPSGFSLSQVRHIYMYVSSDSVIFADGVHKGYKIFIDRDGILQFAWVGLDAPTVKCQISDSEYVVTDTLGSIGMGIERGSLLKVAYTYKTKKGSESNPSPLTIFNENAQHYPDATYDTGYKYYWYSVKYTNLTLPEIKGEEYGSIRVYRSTKEFKDENIPFTVLELAVDKKLDGYIANSATSVIDNAPLKGDIISYENDTAPILNDVVSSGGHIFGLANDIDIYQKFPIVWDHIYKCIIDNTNAESFTNAVFGISLNAKADEVFTEAMLTNILFNPIRVRLIDSDMITPIETGFVAYTEYNGYNDVGLIADHIIDVESSWITTGNDIDHDDDDPYGTGGFFLSDKINSNDYNWTLKSATRISVTLSPTQTWFRIVLSTQKFPIEFKLSNGEMNTIATIIIPAWTGFYVWEGIYSECVNNDILTLSWRLGIPATGGIYGGCYIHDFALYEGILTSDDVILYPKIPEVIGATSKTVYICWNDTSKELPYGWNGSTIHGQFVNLEKNWDVQTVFTNDTPLYNVRSKIVLDMPNLDVTVDSQPNLCSFEEAIENDSSSSVGIDNISKIKLIKGIEEQLPDLLTIELNTGYSDFKYTDYTYYGKDGEEQDTGFFTFFGTYSVLNTGIAIYSTDSVITTLLQSVKGLYQFSQNWDTPVSDGWGLILWKTLTTLTLKLFLSDTEPSSFTLYDIAEFAQDSDINIDFALSFDFSQTSDETGRLKTFVYDYETNSTIERVFDTQPIDLVNYLYLGGHQGYNQNGASYKNELKSTGGIFSRFLFFNRFTLNKIDDFLALKNHMTVCSTSQIGLASGESEMLGVSSYVASTRLIILKAGFTFTSLGLEVGDYIMVGQEYDNETSEKCVGFAKIASLPDVDRLTIETDDSLGVILSSDDERVFTVFKQNQNIQFEELKHLSEYTSNVSNLVWSDVYQTAFPDLNFKKSDAIRIISAPSFLQYKYENTVILFTTNDIYRFVLSDTPENWGSSSTALIKDKVGFGLYAKDSLVFTTDSIIWLSRKGIIVWDANGIKNITKDKNDISISYDCIGGYIPETNQYILEDGTYMWKYDLDTGAMTTGHDFSIVTNTPNYITGKMIWASSSRIYETHGTSWTDTPEVITPAYLLDKKTRINRMNLDGSGIYGDIKISQNQDGIERDTTYNNLNVFNRNIPLGNIWGESFYFTLSNYEEINKLTLEFLEG